MTGLLGKKRLINVQLSKLESKIFDFFLGVLQKEERKTVLRVAGGWVRDKLLGQGDTEADIDIAIDDLTGREFGNIVAKYLHEDEKKNLAVIPRNAEKSKHLETATIDVFGVSVDLVNLRTESYCEHSRVPLVEIGTAEEDAYRRDLTINALFYNINEESVEDFTGKGLMDLQAGLIRTPRPPVETLLDDPLRSLRAIRFAGRLGFKMDDELVEACRKKEVQLALATKVSRERVGKEIDKMIISSEPQRSIKLLIEGDLFLPVFLPPEVPSLDPPIEDLHSMSSRCFELLANFPEKARHLIPKATTQDIRIGSYSALLLPFAGCVLKTSSKRKVTCSAHILREALKLSSRDHEEVDRIHQAVSRLYELQPQFERLPLGLLIRDAKQLFPVAVAVAAVGKDTFKALEVLEAVRSMDLEDVWKMKPMLSGNEIMRLLPRLPKGPKIGEVLQAEVEWQIVNSGATVERCTEWLVTKYAEFR